MNMSMRKIMIFKEFLISEKYIDDVLTKTPIRIPIPVTGGKLSARDKNLYRNLTWEEIDIRHVENNGNFFNLDIYINDKLNEHIMLDIQLVKEKFYQGHIHIAEKLQGLGLGYKVIRKFIELYGHYYSSKGRRMNNIQVPKILNKLKNDNNLSCYTNSNGDFICFQKEYMDESLLEEFNNIGK